MVLTALYSTFKIGILVESRVQAQKRIGMACCQKTGMILLADGGVPGLMGVFVAQKVGVSMTSTYPGVYSNDCPISLCTASVPTYKNSVTRTHTEKNPKI